MRQDLADDECIFDASYDLRRAAQARRPQALQTLRQQGLLNTQVVSTLTSSTFAPLLVALIFLKACLTSVHISGS